VYKRFSLLFGMTNMTEGSPSRLILKFTIPLLAGNVLQQMYNLVDSLVVGNFVGKEALAAVGSTFILNFLLVSLFMGLSTGFSIVISRFLGSGDREKVRSTVDTAYVTTLLGAIPVTLIGVAFARPLLSLMNTPTGVTMDMSSSYLTILFLGTVGSFGYNLNAGILQGLGDSVSSLVFLAVATVLNIVLDLLFVVSFGWGVAGVAWATIISQAVSFLIGVVFIVHKLKLTTLRPDDIRFDAKILKECTRIGLPGGIQGMLFSIGTMGIQRLINGYGPVFMAGYSISSRIDSLAFMPIASFSAAVTTFTGQNAGAGRIDRIKQGFIVTHLMSGAVCIVMSVLLVLNARFLMSLFSPDPEVIDIGAEVLYRLMPAYILLSFIFITNSILRGTGESFVPFVSAMTSFLFLRLPAAYLLDHFLGKGEIGWCYGIGWVFGLSIALPYYWSGKWQRRIRQKI